jgi:isopentenyl-diphosphate delta-isomerase
MIEHELDNIVTTDVDDIKWHKNPDEVMDVRWWKEHEIVKQLKLEPSVFAAWFPMVFDYIKKNNVGALSSV